MNWNDMCEWTVVAKGASNGVTVLDNNEGIYMNYRVLFKWSTVFK